MSDVLLPEEARMQEIYKLNKCVRCGRQYPYTVLNIEGYLHHGCEFECLDRKSCMRERTKK